MPGTNPSFAPTDTFIHRHVGPNPDEIAAMLERVGADSLDALVNETLPAGIRAKQPLSIGPARGEHELLNELRGIASKNKIVRSLIGMGYSDCIVPGVIQRNVLENPGWYTQYTPYQAEISQGRLEALLNFQTMVADLCGLPLAGASLLDEATAAAEAMAMAFAIGRRKRKAFFVADDCHPQTIAVVQTRAEPMGIEVIVASPDTLDPASGDYFGALLQYPNTFGSIADYSELVGQLHEAKALAIVATDLLALTLLRAPGEFGADIVVGSAQRFGVPLGYGGPHAAFLAARDEYKRQLPGRIIGISKDVNGEPALRMAMQTREQHIRRDKATSNICTAQVLLAIMSGMYGVYHGPQGLKAIADRVFGLTDALASGLRDAGHNVADGPRFDTVHVTPVGTSRAVVLKAALDANFNLRPVGTDALCIALDERSTPEEVQALLAVFGGSAAALNPTGQSLEAPHARTSGFMEHPAFHSYRSEHEMLRYLHRLEARDLSLTTSMIALGSCTMKLNGTSEMVPVTWPEFGGLHPFAPLDQTRGYADLFESLERALCDITGFAAVSLQPNAGSQGEYAGLLVIRAFHLSNGDANRNVCLIPTSAHGTNPASAVLAGMRVVAVACDERGNIDVADLRAKTEQHADSLAALMVTYPSTHGVFEEEIVEICRLVHEHGGQVYLDGANMNAQVGLCRPGDYGADVCHLNLHKTFCIPHGGGGPGMGPIGVAEHLAPFLPGSPVVESGGAQAIGAVSAAPWGSASILPISWMYIYLMGSEGLKHATEVAILNANYMATRLSGHYDVLYTGKDGRCGHEFIIDLRPFESTAHTTGEDVAKRLMDYGFHAPTMSFPVAGTLMIEPTESESKAELDRFCDAMISIRKEIALVESGKLPQDDNPLVNAPHTAASVTADEWKHPYSRTTAAFPTSWTREHKFWPSVGRIDNGYGDRNLICTCPPVEAFAESTDELEHEAVSQS